MKKRLSLFMIIMLILLLCSCKSDSKKADISLLSPFRFEDEAICATLVNAQSICFSDYIRCDVSFDIEAANGELYGARDEYLTLVGQDNLTLRTSNGEEYAIAITVLKIDSLVASPRGNASYAIGKPLDTADFEIYGLFEGSRVDLPENAIEASYDFSTEGDTEVVFSCGLLSASVTVSVRGEYIPTLDEDMRTADGGVYALDENGAVLISGADMRGKVTVPRAVSSGENEYPVYAIAEYAFRRNEEITEISCQNVTKIGDGAFFECARLRSVSLPEAYCEIGASCFAYCYSLRSLRLPSDNISVPDGLFSDCGMLFEVYIPQNTEYVGHHAFARCDLLEAIDLPPTVKYIGDGAFKGCSSLAGCIVLGADVSYIGANAFRDCDSLGYVVAPSSPEHIGENAFLAESLFVYTADGKTTAYHCMKNGIPYAKWKYDTLGIINCKSEYEIGDEIDVMTDFYAVLFTKERICRVYGDPEYNFEVSGRRRVELTVLGHSASWHCGVTYNETMLTSRTDSRGAIYDLDEASLTARLTALPERLSAGEVHRFESDVYVLPTSVIYHGEKYDVVGIGDGVFEGRNDIRAVFLHENVQSIGACAFNNCSALEVFSIGTMANGWVDIDDNNFAGVSESLSFVCNLKLSAPHIWATKHGITPIGYENAPHYNEYFSRRW